LDAYWCVQSDGVPDCRLQAATDFFHSEEYQDARNMRLSIATAELTVLEGMPPL